MKVLYGLLWAFLAGVTWTEVRVIDRVRREVDDESVALRERQIAASCRATALSIGGILGVNRLVGNPIPDWVVRPLLSLALGLNSIPAIRFLILYYKGGFK